MSGIYKQRIDYEDPTVPNVYNTIELTLSTDYINVDIITQKGITGDYPSVTLAIPPRVAVSLINCLIDMTDQMDEESIFVLSSDMIIAQKG